MNLNVRVRFFTPLLMFLREYYRNTLNLVLLVVIPVLLISAIGDSLSRVADIFKVPITPQMGKATAALWAAAFLSGIMGFFMMVGAREADRRLVRAGYSTSLVVTVRLTTVALLALLATSVSYVVLLTQLTPVNYYLTFAVLYMAAIIYGSVGILIGSLITGQLEGSFALLFFFVEEAFVSSPLFGSQGLVFLPTYYPSLILSAMVAESSHDAIHWLYAALYGIGVLVLAFAAFYRAARLR